jgi:hypothetical protein
VYLLQLICWDGNMIQLDALGFTADLSHMHPALQLLLLLIRLLVILLWRVQCTQLLLLLLILLLLLHLLLQVLQQDYVADVTQRASLAKPRRLKLQGVQLVHAGV